MARGGGGPARRRLAWRSEPRPPERRRDLRDQLALRIGWVRFWLRAASLGFGLWLVGASLLLWPFLAPFNAPFFIAGLVLIPGGLLLALLSWLAPLPHERSVPCPRCAQPQKVLALPWRLPYTCRTCGRRGWIEGGRIELP